MGNWDRWNHHVMHNPMSKSNTNNTNNPVLCYYETFFVHENRGMWNGKKGVEVKGGGLQLKWTENRPYRDENQCFFLSYRSVFNSPPPAPAAFSARWSRDVRPFHSTLCLYTFIFLELCEAKGKKRFFYPNRRDVQYKQHDWMGWIDAPHILFLAAFISPRQFRRAMTKTIPTSKQSAIFRLHPTFQCFPRMSNRLDVTWFLLDHQPKYKDGKNLKYATCWVTLS